MTFESKMPKAGSGKYMTVDTGTAEVTAVGAYIGTTCDELLKADPDGHFHELQSFIKKAFGDLTAVYLGLKAYAIHISNTELVSFATVQDMTEAMRCQDWLAHGQFSYKVLTLGNALLARPGTQWVPIAEEKLYIASQWPPQWPADWDEDRIARMDLVMGKNGVPDTLNWLDLKERLGDEGFVHGCIEDEKLEKS